MRRSKAIRLPSGEKLGLTNSSLPGAKAIKCGLAPFSCLAGFAVVRRNRTLCRPALRAHPVKLGAEAVADFWDRFDEFGGIAAVAKRPTERGNVFGQVALFDHRVRPDLRHQFVFADD